MGDPGPTSDLTILDSDRGIPRELLARFYTEVLEPSFPPEELVAPWWGEGGDGDGKPLFIALSPDGEVVGGAIGEWYRESRVLLLSYIVARPGWRGQGLGTTFMREIEARWCPHHDYLLVVGEIDDPRHRNDPRQDPWLRLRFYEQFNGWLIVAPYFQPRLRADAPRAYHLMLGVLRYAPEALTSEGKLRQDVLRGFLEEYFTICEGPAAVAEDPQLRWLLDAYRHDLELLPLKNLTTAADLSRMPDAEPPGVTDA
jgi:GNAT superfamily N-acetyltransferase